ncbi:BspA family leucine-rich repeat surface protein [Bifidobacterium sp. ESL0682]|uniref:BspA family leucine-rich repeat surface protein n=1 Tax=Bifidobacterium sp. ESL0682 TaxID=2983212 RepID=UPI0023F62469|nr:BspA family leucine-rich repeat surface protein [Bifidobacterium sp. ESL0682]WEV42772.1 BspA family leucine-rich repeat surface protein [Bifidobacterium sp. ESL0682]
MTLDTTNVTNMSYMFSSAGLATLDLSPLDTTNVTNMSHMFFHCFALATLNLSHFDTTKVTDMSYMFNYCKKLTALDLSNFDTTNVNNMRYMFYFCSNLTTLDLSNFDTTKVTDMSYMFSECYDLTTLDVSNFTTAKAFDTSYMFDGCSRLTTLDLSNFDTTNVNNMNSMFYRTSGLRRVALGANTRLRSTSYFPGSNVSTWVKVDALETDPWQYTLSTPAWSGTFRDLQTLAAGTSPQGVYIDKTLIPTGVRLLADANGGTMPANWSDHVDTNLGAKTLTMPAATTITANKPGSLFAGWNTCQDPATGTGCTAYSAGQGITIAQGDSWPVRTITLYAQWTALPAPKAGTPNVNVPASGYPTISVDITNPSTHYNGEQLYATTHKPETWTRLAAYTADGTGGTTTWTGLGAGNLQDDIGDTYTIDTYATMTDPATGRTVTTTPDTADGSRLHGILPYARIVLDANGGTGAPATIAGLADSTTNKTQLAIPGPGAMTGPTDPGQTDSHKTFTGWNTTGTATGPDTTLNPGKPVDGTNSTRTLYAVWKTVNAPTGLTAKRLASGNLIQITGSSTPWDSTDTVTVCAKRTGTPETAWKCGDTNSADSQWDTGSTTWDGATTHNWTVTIPHDFSIDQAGAYDIKATLNTKGPWAATNTATSLDATASPQIGGTLANLPLTGGRPQHLATLMAAGLGTALLLLAAADTLRAQRRKTARHTR